ncbi:MAG: LLM class flavin-dependent oxidoreductase [Ilumatobacteraceae bacterium]
MQLGVCVASKVDDVEHFRLAEQLGYADLWIADSQLLWSDCYVTMALAALNTERIRIGTGVAVAGTRTSAVTAAAHATLNRLAPGRIFCGIGTGNTAMRVMGAKPIPIAEFERYLVELRLLLDGDEAEVAFRRGTKPIRHLMPDAGFVAFQPRIPLYVSGFGPRAMAAAVRHGDGLVMSIHPDVESLELTWARLDAAAADAGTTLDRDEFLTCTLTTMVVLQPGEAIDSDRVRLECGAFAMAALHYVYEQWREAGRPDRHPGFEFWDDYVAMLDRVDPARLHQRIHQGHNCWVVEEEWPFVTADLIQASCMVGTAEDLGRRLNELGAAGLSQVMILPPLATRDQTLRDVATHVMPLIA